MMDSLSGDLVTRIPLGEAFESRFKYPYALIHRADLHGIFLRACETNRLIGLHPGRTIVRYEDKDGEVTAHAEGGETFAAKPLSAPTGFGRRYAKACWPTGRRACPGTSPIAPCCRPRKSSRAIARMRWCCGADRKIIWSIIRCAVESSTTLSPSSTRAVTRKAGTFSATRRSCIGASKDMPHGSGPVGQDFRMAYVVLCDREPAKEWSRGRVTLLGDAAHPMLQYLAQGAGMAIEDAVVLADQVQVAGGDIATAFARYRDARYLRSGRCRSWRAFYGEFFHAEGVARELRYMVLHDRTAQKAYEGLAWLYDGILTGRIGPRRRLSISLGHLAGYGAASNGARTVQWFYIARQRVAAQNRIGRGAIADKAGLLRQVIGEAVIFR